MVQKTRGCREGLMEGETLHLDPEGWRGFTGCTELKRELQKQRRKAGCTITQRRERPQMAAGGWSTGARAERQENRLEKQQRGLVTRTPLKDDQGKVIAVK